LSKESTVDQNIRKEALKRGAYHRKNHGNEFVRDVPDHSIIYKGRAIELEAKTPIGKLSAGQRKQLRLIQAAGGIGEVCYDPQLVNMIFDCIDRGEPWANGKY